MPPDKYTPLTTFLAALPAETARVTLTFGEIAAIIGEPLPRRMGTGQFWTNRQHQPAARWLAAGWQVTRTTMRDASPTITFARAP